MDAAPAIRTISAGHVSRGRTPMRQRVWGLSGSLIDSLIPPFAEPFPIELSCALN
jgi:hypothetical protein